MALTGSQLAYTQARSGLLRSGAGRSGFYVYNLLLTLYRAGVATNILPYLHHGSLQITNGINDEPDTATFTLNPHPGTIAPLAGEIIEIALGASGNLLFGGQAIKVVARYQQGLPYPWYDVLCVDWMNIFDQRLITDEFHSTSASTILANLMAEYLPEGTFTAQIPANLATIDNLPITNQRLSTVFRTVTAMLGGAFNIEPSRVVRVWAAGGEPQYSQPVTLRADLRTLKQVSVTEDATQVRTRMLVEGKRTTTPLAIPDSGAGPTGSELYSLPVGDSSFFVPPDPPANPSGFPGTYYRDIRIGTQWAGFHTKDVLDPTLNPPGSTVATAAAPGHTALYVADIAPFNVAGLGDYQWVTAGGQRIRYQSITIITGIPGTGGRLNNIPAAGYGAIQSAITVGTEVTRIPYLSDVDSDRWYHAQSADQPVVSLYRELRDVAAYNWAVRCQPYAGAGWRETLAQDGRWSLDGMKARAKIELDTFQAPQVTLDWETDDMNADAGRLQTTDLRETTKTFLVTTVSLSFPLSNRPPRRTCHGVERQIGEHATLLDVLLTDPR